MVYPVYYVEPMRANRALIGLDLGGDPEVVRALEAARDTAQPNAVPVACFRPTGTAATTLTAAVPVYEHSVRDDAPPRVRQAGLKGFIIVVLSLADLMEGALVDAAVTNLDLALYRGKGTQGEPLCAIPPAAGQRLRGPPSSPFYEATIKLPWGTWTAVCSPGPGATYPTSEGREWPALVLGFLFTLLLAAYVRALTGRAVWAENLVAHRTSDLSHANRDLQTEIENRVRSEEALRAGEERYRSLVETMTDGLSVLDPAGKLTYVNTALCTMLGYTPDQMLGKELRATLDETNQAILADQLARRPLGDDAPYELGLTAADGSLVHTIIAPRAMYDAHGRYVGSFGVVTNITERKQIEGRLEQALGELRRSNEELEAFAYVASHDLQEPLRKITAFGDRLESRARDALDEQARDYLGRMTNAAHRMQALINGLLSYSRVTSRAQPFEPVPLDEVLQGVLSDLETRIEEVGGRVHAEPLPTIHADATQMRQLFQNLIGNALKFHKPEVPPVVTLRGRTMADDEARQAGILTPGPVCELTCADNGIGFAPEDADRIFGVFQRLHAREAYEGTGIGLAICRKIAERHGGTLTAQGTPGAGAVLTVRLPCDHPADAQP